MINNRRMFNNNTKWTWTGGKKQLNAKVNVVWKCNFFSASSTCASLRVWCRLCSKPSVIFRSFRFRVNKKYRMNSLFTVVQICKMKNRKIKVSTLNLYQLKIILHENKVNKTSSSIVCFYNHNNTIFCIYIYIYICT